MAQREIGFGIIGCGLMGREVASAAARWFHLLDLDFAPRIVAACDVHPKAAEWFARNVPGVRLVTSDHRELLAADDVEAVYCAVPHNLHAQVYGDIIRAGKHLFGEKPFGIDLAANAAISEAVRANPRVLVRCSSEFPFWPGPYRMWRWAREGRFGRIIEVEAGFWHSSDLDPRKPINWKRMIALNGEYGCLGDLGMHVVHLPFRLGWQVRNVRALLSKIVRERPDKDGRMVPCETWDNAILACEAGEGGQGSGVRGQEGKPADGHPWESRQPSVISHQPSDRSDVSDQSDHRPLTTDHSFPMVLSTKRIAPGQGNTWFIRIYGTAMSAEFSTKNPKELRLLDYTPGGEQAWRLLDLPHDPPYKSITGSIFEFGFSDGLLQMLAAFCDEVANGAGMRQPFTCVTPDEAAASHRLFTAALESQKTGHTVAL